MADSTTTERKPRTQPEFVGEFTGQLPARQRNGYWKDKFNSLFSQNPGKRYEFKNVSASTATNLRRDYGLDAVTHTVNGVTTLYVLWDPSRAEQIKADTVARGEKRKATIAANKASAQKSAARK